MEPRTQTPKSNHFFEHVRIGEPVRVHNVTMFPLVGPDRPGPAYLTLREALAAKLAEVTEVSEGGSVPELLFRNMADTPVFLLDGEELVGAKQNRILNISILVPAKTAIKIPVSCVEQGRWQYASRGFASSERTLFAKARRSKMAHVSQSLHMRQSRAADQGDVWDHIEAKLANLHAASPTRAMSEAFASRAAMIEEIVGNLKVTAGQRGAVFAIGSAIEGVELFDRQASMEKLLASIVRGFALDAAEHQDQNEPAPTAESVSALLEAVDRASVRSYPAIGLGQDLRLEHEAAIGAALGVDRTVVHLSAFAGAQNTARPHRSRASRGWGDIH